MIRFVSTNANCQRVEARPASAIIVDSRFGEPERRALSIIRRRAPLFTSAEYLGAALSISPNAVYATISRLRASGIRLETGAAGEGYRLSRFEGSL